jgi:hypothetical protein
MKLAKRSSARSLLGDEAGQRSPPVAALVGIGPLDQRTAGRFGAVGAGSQVRVKW